MLRRLLLPAALVCLIALSLAGCPGTATGTIAVHTGHTKLMRGSGMYTIILNLLITVAPEGGQPVQILEGAMNWDSDVVAANDFNCNDVPVGTYDNLVITIYAISIGGTDVTLSGITFPYTYTLALTGGLEVTEGGTKDLYLLHGPLDISGLQSHNGSCLVGLFGVSLTEPPA